MRRVVVTGFGIVSALGCTWPQVEARLRARHSAVRFMPEWDNFGEMATRLGSPVDDFKPPEHWSRKQLRSMSRVSQFAVRAAEVALADAGLLDSSEIRSGAMGVACGSSAGSIEDLQAFGQFLVTGDSQGLNANSYVRMMPHTAAANVGIFFGLTGRIVPTSSACTSGSQGIGYAYEAIKYGRQDLMLGGGAEEMSAADAMVFDALFATSRRNDAPRTTPRPFDRDRDGLVVGEGGGMLVLEELEHARARGARIYAEVAGFATNSDGTHVTRPEETTQRRVMVAALADAGIGAAAIGYVNGHGSATEHGDIAESRATAAVFGPRIALSTLKGNIGHSMGACGAIEAWLSIQMMNSDWFAPTLNLDIVDPRCGELDYITGPGRALSTEFVMSNNFAFGGVNTSLVFRRWT